MLFLNSSTESLEKCSKQLVGNTYINPAEILTSNSAEVPRDSSNEIMRKILKEFLKPTLGH